MNPSTFSLRLHAYRMRRRRAEEAGRTPPTKDTNTTLSVPSFDHFSKQNPTAYYPWAPLSLRTFQIRPRSSLTTPHASNHPKTNMRRQGWVGYTMQCPIYGLTECGAHYHPHPPPRANGNGSSGRTCRFAGCSTVGPAVSTTCDLDPALEPRGGCVYLHTHMPSFRHVVPRSWWRYIALFRDTRPPPFCLMCHEQDYVVTYCCCRKSCDRCSSRWFRS